VITYGAYLRIYEPVSAFHEPDRSRWAAYATSSERSGPRESLMVEQAEAVRRAIAAPQIMVPEQESEHAYVRHADGITYICPWQTRLRCLLAYARMLSVPGMPVPGTFPATDDDQAMVALAQLEDSGTTPRPHILASAWAMPLAWFVPFSAAERWLALGSDGIRPSAAATASATRALVYSTAMSHARRRVARALAALRGAPPGWQDAAWEPLRAEAELTEVGRWLEDFHPYSLVELDYGGLVQLLSDDALCGDQSVAEINAAIEGAAKGECELAVAMYKRAYSRWRAFAEFELAN
jgi:hypothetical protein